MLFYILSDDHRGSRRSPLALELTEITLHSLRIQNEISRNFTEAHFWSKKIAFLGIFFIKTSCFQLHHGFGFDGAIQRPQRHCSW